MPENFDACTNCGEQILKGDICLRSSKDMEQIVVVRRDHGVEKKSPSSLKYVLNADQYLFLLITQKHLKLARMINQLTLTLKQSLF